MVARRLVSFRTPYVPVTVSCGRRIERLDALLDTGFEGDVIIPERFVVDAGPPDGQRRFRLADGSEIVRAVYDGTVTVGNLGAFPAFVVALGDECLIGLDLANRFKITLDHGRELVVEP